MMMLFPEKYRPHVGKYHKLGMTLAATLVVLGFGVFIFPLFFSSSLISKHTRFNLTLIGFICIPMGLAILLVVKTLVQNRYQELQQVKATEEQRTVDSRLLLVKNMPYDKFDYHTASRRTLENVLFIMILVFITTLLLDALIFGLILLIPMTIMYGIIWIIDRAKINDFIKLAADGISFNRRGDAGFMRWDQIREIEYDRLGFTIKTNDAGLRITNDIDIEPADLPSPNLLKRFISNTRYDKDLISQIKKLAPHTRDVQWYNYSRL